MRTTLCNSLIVLLIATSVHAANGPIASNEPGWAQWRGPRRDGISNEKGLLQSWPDRGPKLLWKAEGLGVGWSSPIIQGDTIYLTGDVDKDLVIFALGLDGKPKWKKTNGASWTGSYPGARANCTLSEGVLYHANAHGRVAALDPKTGAERWSMNMLERFGGDRPRWAISESVLIDGRRLYVTPGGSKALFAAIDKTNGQTLWSTDPIDGEKPAYASPILFEHGGRRLIANYTNPHAWIVEAETGKRVWKSALKTRWGAAVATPAWGPGGLFIVAPDGPGGTKFDLGDTGATKSWHTQVDTLTGSCLVVDGRLFANGCKAIGGLHALDWKTGRALYHMQRLNPRKPGHAAGAMVWADGRIYGLFEGGRVALLEPAADGFKVHGKFRLVEPDRNDAWAHPVILEGRLYLRYHETLWCYDIRRKK